MPRALPTVLVLVAAIAAACAGPAQAGRLIVTGHDVDLHCSGSPDSAHDQCHYLKVAVDYVRAGSTKPVLVLDRANGEVARALDIAYGPGVVPREVIDPVTPAFAGAALSPATYSAIIVASDSSCGGCDLNPSATADSDAINGRTADIASFFNGGGGVLAFAGASHADGIPENGADVFYNFVPIPVGGVAVSPPFTLTPDGTALGLVDTPADRTTSDINCCATHNSFTLPAAGSALKVAETDSTGKAETLFADGTISGGRIVAPAAGPPATAAGTIKLPSTHRCVSRRHFPIHLRAPRRLRIETALVFVNGRRVRTVRRITVRADVDLRGLPKGRFTVKITLVLSNGKVIATQRRYRTCVPKRSAAA